MVHASHSILDGLAKAGEGKSNIYPAVLSTMAQNVDFFANANQIEDGPSKPVVLPLSKSDATKHFIDRALRGEDNRYHAPKHRYVDAAEDMHGFIPKRRGGLSDTVNDLAKDITCEMV